MAQLLCHASREAHHNRNCLPTRLLLEQRSFQGDRSMSDPESAASGPTETQSSLQNGYSRFDETAQRLADSTAGPADHASGAAQGYVHQGLDNLSRAGSAVAGAIRQRPFISLAVAAIGGAMLAVSRRV
jgi:hypothetical protein